MRIQMLIDLIRANRSYRRFDETHKVTKEQLLDMIEHARLSASAANLQNLKFYLSCDEQTNALVYSQLSWAGYLRYWDGPVPGERPPAYVLVLAPVSTSKYHMFDAGIASQSILLAATEARLGGCMIASIKKRYHTP